jgi:hypothetical protein
VNGYSERMGCCGGKCHGPEFDPDREGVCESDIERFGGDEITCPACGSEVYHDASQCHSCGHAMSDASIKQGATPKWIPLVAGATAVALIGLMLLWMT